MTQTYMIFPIFFLTAINVASAEPTENQMQLLKAAAFQLVLADQCNKRFDDRMIFQLATEAMVKAAIAAGLKDAENVMRNAARDLSEKPQVPAEGFSLASKKFCSDLAEKLGKN